MLMRFIQSHRACACGIFSILLHTAMYSIISGTWCLCCSTTTTCTHSASLMRPDLFIVALRSTVHTHKHTHSILSIPGNGAKQLFFNRLPVSKCIAMHSACCLNTLSHIAQEHHPTIQPTSQPPIRHHKGAKKQGIKFELDKFITSNFICFFSSLSLVVLLRFAWYRSVSDTINQFISVCLRCRYRVHITTSPHCRTVIRIQIKFFFSIFCFFCFHKCLSI